MEAAHEAKEKLLLQAGPWGFRGLGGRPLSQWAVRQHSLASRALGQACGAAHRAAGSPTGIAHALPARPLPPRSLALQYQQMLLEYEAAHEAETHAVEVRLRRLFPCLPPSTGSLGCFARYRCPTPSHAPRRLRLTCVYSTLLPLQQSLRGQVAHLEKMLHAAHEAKRAWRARAMQVRRHRGGVL